MNTNNNQCGCSSDPDGFIVFACSGASDVGYLTDLVARKLSKENIRKMNCLSVIGAGIEKSIEKFKLKNMLIIDGCPVACGKLIAEKSGIDDYVYLCLKDEGYVKGKSPANESEVQKIFEKAKNMF